MTVSIKVYRICLCENSWNAQMPCQMTEHFFFTSSDSKGVKGFVFVMCENLRHAQMPYQMTAFFLSHTQMPITVNIY